MLLATLLATTTTKKAATSSDSYVFLIVILGAYFLFYWFYLRPRWRKARGVRQSGAAIEVGDKVQTIGGLIATVTRLDADTVSVRTDSGVSLDFVRRAIGGKFQPSPEPDPDGDDAHASGDPH